jgi:hypothetical protein
LQIGGLGDIPGAGVEDDDYLMKSHLLVALIAADVAFSIVSIAFATLPLPLSFWRFTLHFSSNFAVLAPRGFPSCFFPLFCLFRSESEAMRKS